MKIEVVIVLMKLMGKEKEAKKIIRNLPCAIPVFETQYKYFGEFLERQEGYITEKYIAYTLVNGVIEDKFINDYQLKAFLKELEVMDLSSDPYLMIADMMMHDEKIHSVPIEYWNVYLNMAKCCDKEIVNRERILKSVKEQIIGSSYKIDDAMFLFNFISKDECMDKNIKALASLKESKPNSATIKKLLELGMSEVDINVLNAALLWNFESARKITNAIVNAFEALDKTNDEWTMLQKSFIDFFYARQFPTKHLGNDRISYFLNLIDFCNNSNYKNVLWFIKSDERDMEYQNLKLRKRNDWNKILSDDFFFQNGKPKGEFLNVITKNYSKDFFTKVLNEYSCFTALDFVNYSYSFHAIKVINDGFINILDEWENISKNILRAYLESSSIHGYSLLKEINEKNPELSLTIVREMDIDSISSYIPQDNPRGFLELFGEIVAKYSMEKFDKYLRQLLFSKEVMEKYFSGKEIHEMIVYYNQILISYPDTSYYCSISKHDSERLFQIYATEEEKQKKREEEEQNEAEESFIKIKDFIHEKSFKEILSKDFEITCLFPYKKPKWLYEETWNLVKSYIPETIVFEKEDEMFDFWEDALSFIQKMKVDSKEYRKIVNSSKVKEG